MIRMLIFDRRQEEVQLLQEEAHRQAAFLTDDRWEILQWLRGWEEETSTLDIVYLDVTSGEGLSAAEKARLLWKNVYMVLIISRELSPLQYLRPTILAASVLLRPLERAKVRESIREAIAYLPSSKEDTEEVLIIADRDGKVRLPYPDILYFEARAKKIYAALKREEYGFYDSMEHLLKRLPSYFIRCHRGYVINLRHLIRYQPTAGICTLRTNAEIPVSRSYRQNVKERFFDWKQE